MCGKVVPDIYILYIYICIYIYIYANIGSITHVLGKTAAGGRRADVGGAVVGGPRLRLTFEFQTSV